MWIIGLTDFLINDKISLVLKLAKFFTKNGRFLNKKEWLVKDTLFPFYAICTGGP